MNSVDSFDHNFALVNIDIDRYFILLRPLLAGARKLFFRDSSLYTWYPLLPISAEQEFIDS